MRVWGLGFRDYKGLEIGLLDMGSPPPPFTNPVRMRISVPSFFHTDLLYCFCFRGLEG